MYSPEHTSGIAIATGEQLELYEEATVMIIEELKDMIWGVQSNKLSSGEIADCVIQYRESCRVYSSILERKKQIKNEI